MARPSDFDPALADTICELLASGHSLRQICESEEMPHRATVFRWLAKSAEFRDQYARAREDQADTLADEILAIADEDPALSVRRQGEDDTITVDGAAVQHQKLRIEARKWIAAKLKPKKYGDRMDLTHAAPDGGPVTFAWKS